MNQEARKMLDRELVMLGWRLLNAIRRPLGFYRLCCCLNTSVEAWLGCGRQVAYHRVMGISRYEMYGRRAPFTRTPWGVVIGCIWDIEHMEN